MEEMEKHLSEIYGRAQKEIEKKTADFWSDFEKQDNAKKKLLDSGDITDDQYIRWRKGQMMTGKHWVEMTKTISAEMLNADKTAAAYVNGKLPEIYALNYNQLKDATSGIKGYSFEMVDAATVRNLATSDKTLLPYKQVNEKKVERWNTQKVNAEVLQGIIQGESIPNIAKRLGNVTEMEKNSAIRNARTTTTSAENKGRMDSYHDAQKQGLVLKKRWIATHDILTRTWHTELDNKTIDVDEPFENTIQIGKGKSFTDHIMYPGDPDADPANVYNCRCTLVSIVEGFGASEDAKNIDGDQIKYSDKMDDQKWDEPKSIINRLTEEYNTKLQEVRIGSEKSAGSTQISGSVMNLSSNSQRTAIHEFAHTISLENQTKFGLYDESEFWKEIKKVRREYKKAVANDPIRWISAYEHSAKGSDEFLAEAFTQAKMRELGYKLPKTYGEDFTYSDKVLSIIDKYFKKKKR